MFLLLGSDLSHFVEPMRIARECRKIIMQNFYGTIAVDSLGVMLRAFGLLNPLLAAFIHVSSELTFILNSTRMLPRGVLVTSYRATNCRRICGPFGVSITSLPRKM
jgi:cation transport ATPase